MLRHCLAIFTIGLLCAGTACALETDQYTVPPKPLPDIGPLMLEQFDVTIDQLIASVNNDFEKSIKAATDDSSEFSHERRLKEAAELLSEDEIPKRLADRWAQGLPECGIEQWVHHLGKNYDITPQQGVFGNWIIDRPITLIEISPTVNMFGVYFGTDKIGHLFQQGYENYRIYLEKIDRGEKYAIRQAVEHSMGQEHGFYGEAMVGSYSNGDLAADYAGLKMYLNFTRPIEINHKVHPQLLILDHTHWRRNPDAGSDWLAAFFSDHFNEAHNPCKYASFMRPNLRRCVARGAKAWFWFYGTTPQQEEKLHKELMTWHGEDYGHSGDDGLVLVYQMLAADPKNSAIIAKAK